MKPKLTRKKMAYYGDLTYISGDLTDISGDVDECDLTDDDRRSGVNIEDLIVT